jgi:hypothetical protein
MSMGAVWTSKAGVGSEAAAIGTLSGSNSIKDGTVMTTSTKGDARGM